MAQASQHSRIQAWIYTGIVCSCAALPLWSQPLWSQEGDIPDTTAEDYVPLPAAIASEEDLPSPFVDPETAESDLEAGAPTPEAPPQPRGAGILKQSVIQREQAFMDALANADETLKLGRDSFERGLMPLEDYADQAQTVLETRLSVASLQNDRAARMSALVNHADLMRSAARQLREFDQPAAAGWAADTAYAELLSANADLRVAAARGDRNSYNSAVARSQQLAETHYDLRVEDFDQGLASLPNLARAASYLSTDVGLPSDNRAGQSPEPSKFADYLTKLAEVVEQTKSLGDLESGVGREDRRHQAEFELAKAEGQAALQRKDKAGAAAAFDRAIDASKAWYDSQVKFHETGTASLRDVTLAWWSRAELTDLTERAGLKPDTATLAETDDELKGLKKLVVAQEDRQGRIAADVAYVKSLENLQGLWARQRAVIAMNDNQSGPGKKTEPSRPRVLELNKNATPEPTPGEVTGGTPTTKQTTPETTIEIIRPKRKPKK